MALRWDKKRKRYIVDLRDGSGKRRWKTLYKGIKKQDAVLEHAKILKDIREHTYRSAREVPRFADLARDWLDNKRADIRQGTYEQYRGHIENHLIPALGNIKADAITYPVVLRFLKTSTASPATARKLLTTLGSIITYGIRCGYATKNPVQYVERPKRENEDREQISVFTPEEIRALVDAEPDQMYKTLFLAAALSGLRQGELFALRWKNILWDKGQISVEHSFSYGELNQPKSRAGKRRVDVPKALLGELRKWRLASRLTGKNDLIFCTATGNYLHRGNLLTRHYKPALKRANITYRKFHTLRHTFCSLLIAQGEDINYCRRMLGHSSISVTIDLYGHLMDSARPSAAEKLGATVLGE
jgi:integrase